MRELVGEIVDDGRSEGRTIGRRSTRSAADEKKGDWWEKMRKKRVGNLESLHDDGWIQVTIWKRDC